MVGDKSSLASNSFTRIVVSCSISYNEEGVSIENKVIIQDDQEFTKNIY